MSISYFNLFSEAIHHELDHNSFLMKSIFRCEMIFSFIFVKSLFLIILSVYLLPRGESIQSHTLSCHVALARRAQVTFAGARGSSLGTLLLYRKPAGVAYCPPVHCWRLSIVFATVQVYQIIDVIILSYAF